MECPFLSGFFPKGIQICGLCYVIEHPPACGQLEVLAVCKTELPECWLRWVSQKTFSSRTAKPLHFHLLGPSTIWNALYLRCLSTRGWSQNSHLSSLDIFQSSDSSASSSSSSPPALASAAFLASSALASSSCKSVLSFFDMFCRLDFSFFNRSVSDWGDTAGIEAIRPAKFTCNVFVDPFWH